MSISFCSGQGNSNGPRSILILYYIMIPSIAIIAWYFSITLTYCVISRTILWRFQDIRIVIFFKHRCDRDTLPSIYLSIKSKITFPILLCTITSINIIKFILRLLIKAFSLSFSPNKSIFLSHQTFAIFKTMRHPHFIISIRICRIPYTCTHSWEQFVEININNNSLIILIISDYVVILIQSLVYYALNSYIHL